MPGWLRSLGDVLAWPGGAGILCDIALGLPAYLHTHARLSRQHAERLAQAERLPGGDHGADRH